MKKFDIAAAEAGASVCTRDGRAARIICFDRKATVPIVSLVTQNGAHEVVYAHFADGRISADKDSPCDLMMAPTLHKGWCNIYKAQISKGNWFGSMFDSEEMAKENIDAAHEYVSTAKVEWLE